MTMMSHIQFWIICHSMTPSTSGNRKHGKTNRKINTSSVSITAGAPGRGRSAWKEAKGAAVTLRPWAPELSQGSALDCSSSYISLQNIWFIPTCFSKQHLYFTPKSVCYTLYSPLSFRMVHSANAGSFHFNNMLKMKFISVSECSCRVLIRSCRTIP